MGLLILVNDDIRYLLWLMRSENSSSTRKCIRSRIVRLSHKNSSNLRTPLAPATAVAENNIYISTLHTHHQNYGDVCDKLCHFQNLDHGRMLDLWTSTMCIPDLDLLGFFTLNPYLLDSKSIANQRFDLLKFSG
jgi:hypothetical protein